MFNNPPAKYLDDNETVVYRSKTCLFWNILYLLFLYAFIDSKFIFLLFQHMKNILDTILSLFLLIISVIIFIYVICHLIDVIMKRFWITNKNLILTYFFKTYKIPLSEISGIYYSDSTFFRIFRLFFSSLVIITKTNRIFTILGTTCNDVSKVFKGLKKSPKKKNKEFFIQKMINKRFAKHSKNFHKKRY